MKYVIQNSSGYYWTTNGEWRDRRDWAKEFEIHSSTFDQFMKNNRVVITLVPVFICEYGDGDCDTIAKWYVKAPNYAPTRVCGDHLQFGVAKGIDNVVTSIL